MPVLIEKKTFFSKYLMYITVQSYTDAAIILMSSSVSVSTGHLFSNILRYISRQFWFLILAIYLVAIPFQEELYL